MRKHMQKFLKLSERSLTWLIASVIVFAVLFMKFPLIFVKGSFVSVRIEDLIIALTFFAWGGFIIYSGKIKKLFKDKLFLALLTFFLVTLFSVVSSAILTRTTNLSIAILHWLRRVEMMALSFVVATTIRDKRQAIFYLKTLFLTGLIVIFFGFGQKFLSFPIISTVNSTAAAGFVTYMSEGGRLISTFAGHYDLAIFLMFFVILVFARVFYDLFEKGKTKKSLIRVILLLTLSSVLIVLLVMTAARLTFAALFGGVAILIIFLKKFKYLLLPFIFGFLFLLYPSQLRDRYISTVRVNLYRSWDGFSAVTVEHMERSGLNIPTLGLQGKRIDSGEGNAADIVPGEPTNVTDLGVYRSFAIRFNVEWPRAVRAFKKNPLLGTGYSSIDYATDNDFLRSLGETGVFGTYALFLVFYVVIKRIRRGIRSKNTKLKYFSAGLLAVIISYLINGMFIDVLEASKIAIVFWILVGIYFGYAKNVKNSTIGKNY